MIVAVFQLSEKGVVLKKGVLRNFPKFVGKQQNSQENRKALGLQLY